MEICNRYFLRILVLISIGILLTLATLFGEDVPYKKNSGRGSSPLSTGNSGIILVQNPGQGNDIRPNLEAAWKRASAGDTIMLPGGRFSYSGSTFLPAYKKSNVYIKGRGSGPDGTILYREKETQEWMIEVWGSAGNIKGAGIEISDIWFQAMDTKLYKGDDGISYPLFRGVAFRGSDFYLHHCKFQWFSSRAVGVSHPRSYGMGVIANNDFLECLSYKDGRFSRGYGINVGVWGPVNSWTSVSPGSKNFVFIEDNYFARLRPAVASGPGALFVFRYNKCERNSSESGYVDMHGAQPEHVNPDYQYSARFAEIYENVFTATPPDDMLHVGYEYGPIGFKGGASYIHNNTFNGFSSPAVRLSIADMWFSDYYNHPTDWEIPAYPIPYQIGWESGRQFGPEHTGLQDSTYGAGDCFIWNNSYIDSERSVDEGVFTHKGEQYHYIREGRDYHHSRPSGYSTYIYPHPRRQ